MNHPSSFSGASRACCRALAFCFALGPIFLPSVSRGQTSAYNFTTFAGSSGYGVTDGVGTVARFDEPSGVAADAAGNVYVADRYNHTIRKISPAGVVTTLAGLPSNSGSANGTGSDARFHEPFGIAVDTAGNLYVAEILNHTIRKITPAGAVTTLAGLAGTSGSADGTGGAARFNGPRGIAVDSAGVVFVADSENDTVRRITAAGAVSTLAGLAGSRGTTNATGSAARFNYPTSVAVDAAGNVYVADRNNHTIRRVTAAGVVSTLAGQAGNAGALDATGTAALFSSPHGLALEAAGSLLVADSFNHTIRRVTAAGVVTTVAGFTGARDYFDGTGTGARFNEPAAVAVDGAGNVFIADTANCTVRKMTPARVVTTFAGATGGPGTADGTGNSSRFHHPRGIAVDALGNVFVADTENHTIRRITTAGVSSTFAGSAETPGPFDGVGTAARFAGPEAVAVDAAGNVYVADTGNHTIRKITPARVVTHVAGLPGVPGSANGTQGAARFNYPSGIAVDTAGTLYVADTYNHTVRKVTPAGAVTTFAGLAGSVGSTDGAGAAARFNYPYGIGVDAAGNVFVSDSALDAAPNTGGHVIRKISPAGVVTTLAGLASSPGAADGSGNAARFYYPLGLAVDSAGNVFVAEYWNNVIRKITAAGAVTTVGGPGGGAVAGKPYNDDGVGSAVRLFGPNGIAVSSSGTLYVADTFNNTIRKGVLGSARLINISVLSVAGTGAQTLIAGFNVGGSGSKQILLRGIGPGLIEYGVTGVVADPQLTLFNEASVAIDQNNDWGGSTVLANAFAGAGAFALPPASKDSALLRSLPVGGYSAQVTAVAGTGTALVEAYDTEAAGGTARLVNISARTLVASGGGVLTVGFVVGGDGPRSIVIRAVGPTLAQYGLTGLLADPKLDLFAGPTRIGGSDNWTGATLNTSFDVVGAFALGTNSKDAAIVATLPPGEYSVQVTGVNGASGVALVELYEMP